MKKVFIIVLTVFLALNAYTQEFVKIYGHVTDFNNQKQDSVTIRLKNDKLESLYETVTDSSGFYSLTVAKGTYNCLSAVKLSGENGYKFEYLAWTIPAYTDLKINPQYDRIIMQNVNSFWLQYNDREVCMVYFRPISKSKSAKIEAVELNGDTIDIAPDLKFKDELEIFINGAQTDIINITKIFENFNCNFYLYGYFVQVKKHEKTPVKKHKKTPVSPTGYDKISIILKSKETNECGRSDCFVRR